MSAEEFGGFGFAAGVVRGTRSFDIDKLGRLTGVYYKQVWKPGENEAKCLVKDDPLFYRSMDSLTPYTRAMQAGVSPLTVSAPGSKSFIAHALGFGADAARVTAAAEEEARRREIEAVYLEREAQREAERARVTERRANLATCGHGFYGYYDGSNDYYEKGRVMGVIEGYGETVIGSRGFRAMKARIVALRIPKHVPAAKRLMVLRNYPEVPVFDRFSQMVAEFPPDDAGSGVSPQSDPDFWTRSA